MAEKIQQKRQRKFWGWGYVDAGPNAEQEKGIARIAAERFGVDGNLTPIPQIEEIQLAPSRLHPPGELEKYL